MLADAGEVGGESEWTVADRDGIVRKREIKSPGATSAPGDLARTLSFFKGSLHFGEDADARFGLASAGYHRIESQHPGFLVGGATQDNRTIISGVPA
jgi:hypothetical protein